MNTMTQQTTRRRRGREIRKARRLERIKYQRALRSLPALRRLVAAAFRVIQDAWTTLCVAIQRVTPLLPPPHDGAGARRQLPSGRKP